MCIARPEAHDHHAGNEKSLAWLPDRFMPDGDIARDERQPNREHTSATGCIVEQTVPIIAWSCAMSGVMSAL